MYSNKIQANVQKDILTNLQTKNSLDFSGLFLGPEKNRENQRKVPGEKKSCKKIPAFLQKKNITEKFTEKNYRKKNSANFSVFFGYFWHFSVII